MSPLNIELPEDVRALAHARAAQTGHATVERYLESLIRADAAAGAADLGGPEHLTFETDEEIEAMLLRRADDNRPAVEATAEFWQDLKRRVKSGAGGAEGP